MKVCKFGGTSMATANSVEQVAHIVLADESRAYVIASAPGKRFASDVKVTDLLVGAYEHIALGVPAEQALRPVFERFYELVEGLGLAVNLAPYFATIVRDLENGENKDYCVSRGEYLSAIVLANRLGWEMVDAVDIVKFFDDGRLDAEYTNDLTARRLLGRKNVVVSGFYGQIRDRHVKTFPRGGADISGAIVARAVGASVYENWTDVDGILACDPRIVACPKSIATLTYRELRELSYMGASVLHPDAIFPTCAQGIPINVRNTFAPQKEGTMIVPTDRKASSKAVTGISGKKHFLAIHIRKSMMSSERGFVRRALTVLEHYGVSVEHSPSGVDTLSLVMEEAQMPDELARVIVSELKATLGAKRVYIEKGLALIATVGQGLVECTGTVARLFGALAKANVKVVMIDQGSSEQSIIVGVREEQFEQAVNALYDALVAGE